MAKLQNVTTVNMVNGEITAIKYDGAVYSKVDDKAMLSDIVRTMNGAKDVTTGAYYSVSVRDENGDVAIRDDVYDKRSSLGRFDVFRKASASAPFAEMVVSRVEAVEKRMDALEGAKDTETLVKGDRVLISGKSIYGTNKDGMFGRFDTVDMDGDHNVEFGNGESRLFRREQLTKVAGTDAPVKPKSRRPATGDIVVITANTNDSRNKVGDIGKVEVAPSNSVISVSVRVPGGSNSSAVYTRNSEMRLATPAEIAQYEKAKASAVTQAAKDSVFTKAGRKPNEYREGDVVRVTDDDDYTSTKGEYAVVARHYGTGGGGNVVMTCGSIVLGMDVEIVCFAENRSDLAKGVC